MLRTSSIGSNVREVNLSFLQSIQLTLSLLSSLTQTLHSHGVLGEIHSLLLLEGLHQILEQCLIEILSSQQSISISCLHFEHTSTDLQKRNIEGTTSQIINSNHLTILLVQTISQRGCSRLIDDTLYIQTSNTSSILSSLTLTIVEVSRHSNNGLLHRRTEETLSSFLHLGQNHRTNLRRRHLLSTNTYPSISVITLHNLVGDQLLDLLNFGITVRSTNQTLCSIDSVLGICDSLTLSSHTHHTITVFKEGNNRRSGTSTLRVFNNTSLRTLQKN